MPDSLVRSEDPRTHGWFVLAQAPAAQTARWHIGHDAGNRTWQLRFLEALSRLLCGLEFTYFTCGPVDVQIDAADFDIQDVQSKVFAVLDRVVEIRQGS